MCVCLRVCPCMRACLYVPVRVCAPARVCVFVCMCLEGRKAQLQGMRSELFSRSPVASVRGGYVFESQMRRGVGHGFCVCAGRCRHAAFFFFFFRRVCSLALFALVSKPVVLGATNLEGWKEMCTNWGRLRTPPPFFFFRAYFYVFLNICVVIFFLSLFLAWFVYPSFIFLWAYLFCFYFV